MTEAIESAANTICESATQALDAVVAKVSPIAGGTTDGTLWHKHDDGMSFDEVMKLGEEAFAKCSPNDFMVASNYIKTAEQAYVSKLGRFGRTISKSLVDKAHATMTRTLVTWAEGMLIATLQSEATAMERKKACEKIKKRLEKKPNTVPWDLVMFLLRKRADDALKLK